MTKIARLFLALLFAAALVACGDDGGDASQTGDGGDDTTERDAGDDADAGDDSDDGAASGPGGGTLTLAGDEFTVEQFRCFFEEQPRAGLGGVFTHTAQGDFTTADGESAIVDMSRARAEDGTVSDDISVEIGDFTADDAVSLNGGGPEGTIEFGDDSASASGIEVTETSDIEAEPLELSFDLSCG